MVGRAWRLKNFVDEGRGIRHAAGKKDDLFREERESVPQGLKAE
jgi:hypothetical protein